MHSFEVNIRICQPGKSDVHIGKDPVSLFLVLYKVFFIFVNKLNADVPNAMKTVLF